MFADRLRIAEVMVLLNQTVEKFFLGRPSDLAKVDRIKILHWGGNRNLTNLYDSGDFSTTERVIIDFESGW